MRQLLFIAYLFPPGGGAGVQRSAKFVKYLPQFGWQPTVLTTTTLSATTDSTTAVNPSPPPPIHHVRGLSLPARLPWRIKRWLTRWLFIVDAEIGWYPFAVKRGKQLLHEQNVESIYSTSSPYTDHLVALRLKHSTGLPWVADFRDPWLDNFSALFPTRFHRAICSRLELRIVTTANCILVVSEPMRQQFLQRYPHLPASRFITIPNGFDPDDFNGVSPIKFDKTKLTLVYTGSLYGKQQSARPFLTALHQLITQKALSPETFQVHFVGNAGIEAPELVTKWGLSAVVHFAGYLSHAEMLRYQLGADALLLIIGSGPGSDVVFTGKIFEYLAAEKLILALIPPGAATDLLTEAGTGWIAPPDEVDAIAANLLKLNGKWQNGQVHIIPNPAVIARFDRKRQAAKLAKILNEAIT